MPGMDGWRVLQALKYDPRTAEIPVIVCSLVDNRALGYRLGASAYLLKPVEPEQLTTTLNSVSHVSGLAEQDGHVLRLTLEFYGHEVTPPAVTSTGPSPSWTFPPSRTTWPAWPKAGGSGRPSLPRRSELTLGPCSTNFVS